MAAAVKRGGQSYFVDSKKGEVNELKTLLRSQAVERDAKKKKDVIKKVIAYMTLGYDVSKLFGEMVMACGTGDIIAKKMCYLYLANYAETNEELATLCINTMTKDCQDTDPMVRGLALRSLSSLKLQFAVEYLLPILSKSFSDKSAYVRRTAVVAVLKLNDLKPEVVKDSEFVKKLYSMIEDRDTQVTSACLMVLNEILIEEGGIEINKKLILHLLNRIRGFNEWGQCMVLHLLSKYQPSSTEEKFDIMNVLDDLLKVSNSAVVLGTAKCFLIYADSLPELKQQIYLRLKQPMLTLIAGANREIRYSILQHIHLMVIRCPGVFDSEFKQFYCNYNEPMHVRYVKLQILPELTNEQNVHELVAELSEYVEDINQEFARSALQAFGKIAVKIPAGADGIINQLLEFISMEIDYVRSGVVCVVKDLLRKYPDRAGDVLPALPRCLRRIQDPKGRAAVIFMLGEYGADVKDTPYLLEKVIDTYDAEASEVKLALLTATLKLFFKRAPECQAMLARLIQMALNDTTDTDLHDRALLYYRLLRASVEKTASIVGAKKPAVVSFTEEDVKSLKQRLFQEFNSLSVLYQKPPEQFVDEKHRERPREQTSTDFGFTLEPTSEVKVPETTPPVVEQDLYDSVDLLDLGGNSPVASPKWSLKANAEVEQSTFQTLWESLPQGTLMDLPLSKLPSADELEAKAQQHNISCMASGDLGDQLKFYFFARDNIDKLYLAEVMLNKRTSNFSAVVKTQVQERADSFASVFTEAIMDYF